MTLAQAAHELLKAGFTRVSHAVWRIACAHASLSDGATSHVQEGGLSRWKADGLGVEAE